MTTQLRIYYAKPGELENLIELWKSQIKKPRLAAGFDVGPAWKSTDKGTFVCVVSVPGDIDDFRAAEDRFHAAVDRTVLARELNAISSHEGWLIEEIEV